jgi:hypothetical protein
MKDKVSEMQKRMELERGVRTVAKVKAAVTESHEVALAAVAARLSEEVGVLVDRLRMTSGMLMQNLWTLSKMMAAGSEHTSCSHAL